MNELNVWVITQRAKKIANQKTALSYPPGEWWRKKAEKYWRQCFHKAYKEMVTPPIGIIK